MNDDGALFDSGFDGRKPFPVTPVAGGISLESALRDFGPAAIDDLIPRVRAIAHSLDAAHAAGAVHGALRPSYVIVTDDTTQLIAGSAPGKPYVAPEVSAGGPPGPASDQFGLAAITYEWLFGKPITGPAVRPVDVRTMPGVDRAALSKAFTRALSPRPEDRFASCADFCDALLASTTLELPLVAGPIDSPFDSQPDGSAVTLAQGKADGDEVEIAKVVPALEPDAIDSSGLVLSEQPEGEAVSLRGEELASPPPQAVASWNPAMAAAPAKERQRFSGFALILATIVGSVFGFAAGYMARPRALQSGPPQEFAIAPGGAGQAGEAGRAGGATGTSKVPPPASEGMIAPSQKPAAKVETPPARPASPAQPAPPASIGRLLVRSTPSGATVSVDGAPRGTTPLALRDVDIGTRTVTIARRGYIPETRTVQLSKERPSRSLEVRLTAEPEGGPPRPSTPATLGKPAVSTGSLAIESRPAGAAVTIDGKPRGKTPLTINDLAPGDYRVTFTLPGYRNVATTVRVVAGERARAAASLSAQEHE